MAERDSQSMGRKLPVVTLSYGQQGMSGAQGQGSGWFGPLAPMSPLAPPEVKGRILDYQTGYNLHQRPRTYEPITFEMLRNFADAYDLLRLVIETRKDQLSRLGWNITVREHAKAKRESLKPMIEEIEKFFIRPDKEHFWPEWIRLIAEDLFVLDAPAIYRRRLGDGSLYALQPIDGATIKRIIDDYGNTPEAPAPAYQQVLKGVPAVDYTTEDLLYRPRNGRTHKIYGFSQVEQVIMTVQIAMRRQIWQLQSFTEGNVPEALIGVPETWTPDQIKLFQDWFDATLSGQTGERRRARFVPGGVAKGYVATKPDQLFGEAEEWLARVICFAFSISPQPFVKMMNRATAETAQETAIEEGLTPIQNWVKSIVDTVIIEDFACEDLEFQWADEDELDPKAKSEIDDKDLGNGKRTFNEIRADSGLDPIKHPDADRPMLRTTTGYVPIFKTPEEEAEAKAMAATIAGKGPGKPGEAPPGPEDDHDPTLTADEEVEGAESADDEVAGAETADDEVDAGQSADEEVAEKSAVPFVKADEGSESTLSEADLATFEGHEYVNPDRKAAKKATKVFRKTMAAALATLGRDVAKQVQRAWVEKGLGKADDSSDDDDATADDILKGLNIEFDTDLSDDLAEELASVFSGASRAAIGQLGVTVTSELVDQVNEASVSWAAEHAAELVGINPDSEAWIPEATREQLRATIVYGMEDNLSAEDIADNIREAYAFSEERAQLVAMTEIASANSQGALNGYQEAETSGIGVRKSWLILESACGACHDNADAGKIALEAEFPSGDTAPPAHPNCRCVLIPVVDDDEPKVEE